jgi:hypothetical protein
MKLLAYVTTILTTSHDVHETTRRILFFPHVTVSAADSPPDSTPPTMTSHNHPYTPPYLREAAVAHPKVETTVDRHVDGPHRRSSKTRMPR